VIVASLEKTLLRLNTPWKIQEYLSRIPYNPDDYSKSAVRVFEERSAHCFEGALFASLALERLGHEPSLLHLRSHRDDDHVVALFREKGLWGAVGKSNTTLLSWRTPVYRNLHELFLSYFPFYFNLKGQMSLCSWAGPIRLKKYEKTWNWRDGEEDVGDMSASFYDVKGTEVISPQMIERHPKAAELLTAACFLGANKKGLYRA
jgi:hypothetical protein